MPGHRTALMRRILALDPKRGDISAYSSERPLPLDPGAGAALWPFIKGQGK